MNFCICPLLKIADSKKGMEKETFEAVLRKSFNESKIERIIEMKVESALPKGENYSSTILKITMKVVLRSGRITTKSFIAKKEKTARRHQKMFITEVLIYSSVIKEMEYLMEEFGDSEGPLWCKFIHYSPSDGAIIFEDLKASGFTTVKRTEVQDLEHSRLVLRSLGRYHAMAKVLEERGLISNDDYKPYPFINDEVYVRNFIYGGKQALVKGMRAAWGEKWTGYADKMGQIHFEEFFKKIKQCGDFDEDTFKCLNHGDCWNNNMMFKYNWEGRPIEMRFVDFQIPHYNSPCIDVIYYMYTSIKSDVRRRNYGSLVELYHESLTSSLDRFSYKGSKPSLEDINNAMERLTYFALNFFTGVSPCVLTERTDALDLELIMKTNGKEGFNTSVYTEDGIIEKIGEEIKRIVKSEES